MYLKYISYNNLPYNDFLCYSQHYTVFLSTFTYMISISIISIVTKVKIIQRLKDLAKVTQLVCDKLQPKARFSDSKPSLLSSDNNLPSSAL